MNFYSALRFAARASVWEAHGYPEIAAAQRRQTAEDALRAAFGRTAGYGSEAFPRLVEWIQRHHGVCKATAERDVYLLAAEQRVTLTTTGSVRLGARPRRDSLQEGEDS